MVAFPRPETITDVSADLLAIAEVVTEWLRPAGPGAVALQTAAWGESEWEAARKAALVHGIAPLLASRLTGTPAWSIFAPRLREYCAAQYALNQRRLALMLDDLGAILGAAAAHGVAVLPLKGAVLAARFYKEPALRPMADLDLLVRPAHIERMDAAMVRLGFHLAEETPRHRAYLRGEPTVASWDGEHPDNPRGVEIHAFVGERLRAISYDITESLWRGVMAGSYAGTLGLVLRPGALLEHLLIHTCHNMVNRRLRLIQLYDIALVAPSVDPPAWRAMADAALKAGEARLLYAPLALAEALFGPLAPEAIRRELMGGTPPGLHRLLLRSTPSELSFCASGVPSPEFRLAWYWPGKEQLRAIAHVLLPTAAELRQRYPTRTGGLIVAYARHLRHTLRWVMRVIAGQS